MRQIYLCLLLGVAVVAGGCGAESYPGEAADNAAPPNEATFGYATKANRFSSGEAAEPLPVRQDQALGGGPAVGDRKIIYTAVLHLVVPDFEGLEQRVEALVQSAGGYVADYRADRTQGERRAGEWIVRVPVGQFDGFLDAVGNLGVPESRHVSSQDVSEEFVDLEARLKNQRRLEERILQVLAEHTGKIEDLLHVETELARVRQQIEQMEGRLRYLSNRVDLTTVTIAVREERDYQPPQAPTFVTRVGDTFAGSLATLRETGEAVALATVALVPWSPLAATLVALPVLLVRRKRRAAPAVRTGA